tara:strand:+ start:1150 stop:1398 length:249 start_codon:yes stop_codon:yes gene_type:complete
MHEIDTDYTSISEDIDENVVQFKKENKYVIRSRVHTNIILTFKSDKYWLAQVVITLLNRLDHRDKPLNIDNFYIEGEHEKTN